MSQTSPFCKPLEISTFSTFLNKKFTDSTVVLTTNGSNQFKSRRLRSWKVCQPVVVIGTWVFFSLERIMCPSMPTLHLTTDGLPSMFLIWTQRSTNPFFIGNRLKINADISAVDTSETHTKWIPWMSLSKDLRFKIKQNLEIRSPF